MHNRIPVTIVSSNTKSERVSVERVTWVSSQVYGVHPTTASRIILEA